MPTVSLFLYWRCYVFCEVGTEFVLFVLMSGFKEIIQNTFCVLSPQVPKCNHFWDIDVYQWHNVRREEERFKIKKKIKIWYFCASQLPVTFMCVWRCCKLWLIRTKHFADPAFHTVPQLLDVNCCCHTYSYVVKFYIILM